MRCNDYFGDAVSGRNRPGLSESQSPDRVTSRYLGHPAEVPSPRTD